MIDGATGRPPARRARRAGAVAGLVLLAAAAPGRADAQRVLGDGIALHCTRAGAARVQCDYRLVRPSVVSRASARIGGVELPPPAVEAYIEPPASSAVLFLVDTSDPGRAPAVARKIRHIDALLDAGGPHHHFGLATFDSDFRLLAPIGARIAEVRARAASLRATGQTTELYRAALEAVRVLARSRAERRALLLLSDGQAEDRAYFLEDVARAARASGVVIYGIGYPRTPALSVALQSLRRLAEETGGVFAATDADFALPPGFFQRPFRVLDNGGRITAELDTAHRAGLEGGQRLELELQVAGGRVSATVPVELAAPVAAALPAEATEPPAPEEKPAAMPRVIEVAAAADAPSRVAESTAGSGSWMWYVLLTGVLVVILLLGLLFSLRLRRRARSLGDTGPSRAVQTLAFLEPLDGSGERRAVTSAAFRIGRHSDNEFPIRDSSVSRQHAEIHRRRDGRFTITDLDSMNGVFVNQTKIDSVGLDDGDVIEIGDHSFRFRVKDHDPPTGEETVALKTVSPSSRLPDIPDGE